MEVIQARPQVRQAIKLSHLAPVVSPIRSILPAIAAWLITATGFIMLVL